MPDFLSRPLYFAGYLQNIVLIMAHQKDSGFCASEWTYIHKMPVIPCIHLHAGQPLAHTPSYPNACNTLCPPRAGQPCLFSEKLCPPTLFFPNTWHYIWPKYFRLSNTWHSIWPKYFRFSNTWHSICPKYFRFQHMMMMLMNQVSSMANHDYLRLLTRHIMMILWD